MDVLADLIGASPAIESVRETIRRLVARQRGARRLPSVLIQGETGTGKGLVARLIHRAGPRPDGPFVDVNCAAIPEALLEAELLGFERGAFTDARRAKPGLFQTAHRGSIFLDEVGLLPEALQGKVLKVIEDQAVRRLGSTVSEPIDTWVISVTNIDLQTAIREGRFRDDLYHRLAVLTFWLPPLRDRGRDVLMLAEQFLARTCADYGLPEKTLAPSARARLLAHSWPGNIRELSNVIERVALLSEGDTVTGDMLELPESPAVAPAGPRGVPVSFDDVMRDHLTSTLKQTRWNISRTAAILGISRNTLRARIDRLGLKGNGRLSQPGRPVRVVDPGPSPYPAAVLTAPSTIRWERRRITLLRASLSAADGEELSGSSRSLDMVVDKVRSFGGRVEEISPAGLGASFGLDPSEDAARRAGHAANAIQKAAERSRERGKDRFDVKIGIHVAQVLVGQSGHHAEIESEAKRAQWKALESMMAPAEASATVVSAAAATFLERGFRLARAGESRGEPLFALGGRGRLGLAPRGRMAGFVGRHQELDLLRSRLDAVKAGHGQVVGIVGEPGIGKSRLLHEFRKSLRGQRIAYLQGHCVSYGTAMPYVPVLELLRHGCRISDEDTPEEIAAKLRGCLTRLAIDPAGLPYLLQLLGVKDEADPLAMISPDAIQARTFSILRQMCAGASRHRPLIISVEDMHWIDAASEAFAATLESVADLPLLLVVTYRPGYQPPWADPSHVTQIALQPLSEQDSRSVVHHLLPPTRAAFGDLIVARAKGNPFFLEELARSAALQEDAETAVAAPDTIEDALLARVNRLDPASKRLLEIASVLGREAPREIMSTMWDGERALEEPVRDLIRHELLHARPGGDEPTYVFKHVLVQEVVYASLADDRRRALHAAAGSAFETLYAGRSFEVVDMLAHHFFRSDADDSAVDYLIQAAEKARRRGANAEALTHFDTARECLDGMPDTRPNRLRRIDAVVKQAEVKFALGRHAEHIQALEGIRPLVETSADPARRGAWYGWTGFLQSLTGSRPEAAIAHCREAAAIADIAGLSDLRAFAECCLAHAHAIAGNFREALAAGERALPIFEANGNVWWACRALWFLNMAALYLGDWRRSIDYCQRALTHAEEVDDLRLKIASLSRLASCHVQRGDVEIGLGQCEAVEALGPGPFDTAMLKIVRGHGLVKTGEIARGTRELEAALEWFDKSGLSFTRSLAAVRLAEAYLIAGDRPAARDLLEPTCSMSRELGYRYIEGVVERLMGATFLPDDLPRAQDHLARAVRMLEGMGARDELARALANTADHRRLAGDPEQADALLDRATRILEDLGAVAWPAHHRPLPASR